MSCYIMPWITEFKAQALFFLRVMPVFLILCVRFRFTSPGLAKLQRSGLFFPPVSEKCISTLDEKQQPQSEIIHHCKHDKSFCLSFFHKRFPFSPSAEGGQNLEYLTM